MDEEERNYCCLAVLPLRVGNPCLRLYFKKQWDAVGIYIPWTDCAQNGADLLRMFKPLSNEKNKVQCGDTSTWDFSIFLKVLLHSRPPFVTAPNLVTALKTLQELRNGFARSPLPRITTPDFQKAWTDACAALSLFGAVVDDFVKVKEDYRNVVYNVVVSGNGQVTVGPNSTIDENYCCLVLLVLRVGNPCLRLYFKKQWDAAGTYIPWTDCAQNGADLLRMFKPPPYEKNKVQCGDTSTWDVSIFAKVLLHSRPPFVTAPNLVTALKTLREMRNDLFHSHHSRITTPDFKKAWTDVCAALSLFGAVVDDFVKVKEDVTMQSILQQGQDKIQENQRNILKALSSIKQDYGNVVYNVVVSGNAQVAVGPNSTINVNNPNVRNEEGAENAENNVPSDINARGPKAQEAYQQALKEGKSTEFRKTEMGIDGSEQSVIAICPEYFAYIEHDILTISADIAAERIAERIPLNKTSLEDPTAETVKKVRRLCVYLKEIGRLDIMNALRTTLPSGMTGPCVDENVLYERFDSGKRKILTQALCGDELWKRLAEEFGISNARFRYFDRMANPAEAILEEVCKARRLTVEDVYDIIVKCGVAPLADKIFNNPNARNEEGAEDAENNVPLEIIARGPKAQEAYQQALKEGKVQVYRGRIMLIGQDRAGKTSLKKSLLGLKFEADEPSTVGVDVDPSSFSVDVDNVIEWKKLEDSPQNDFEDNIARMMAEKLRKKLEDEKHEQEVRGNKPVRSESETSRSNNPGLQDSDNKPKSSESETPRSNNPGLKHRDEAIDDNPKHSKEDHDGAVDNGEISDKTKREELETTTSLPQKVTVTGAENRPSDEVIENVIKHLLGKNLDDVSSEDKVMISVWDFAGQQLYYASHPVFFSHRAVYLLVYNMNKDLKAEAQPCVRQGGYDIDLENHEKQTNLESILSWLVSVHCVRPEENVKRKDGTDLPYLQPPVIIVGTHADCPFEASEIMEAIIRKTLRGKGYNEHVVPSFITVDNRSADDKGIRMVKDEVNRLFKTEPYMGEDIPVRWLKFEKVIKSLVEDKGLYHLPLNDLEEIVRKICQIENKDEMKAMLNFYHDLGVIVKHGNTVVLKTEWLIDLFKRLITIKPYQEQIPRQRRYWDKLENEGILDIGLVEYVFNDLLKSDERSETKEDILAMMEKYALIARFGTPNDFHFFVPVQLQSSPGEVLDAEPTELDPCALYLKFADGFIPHGLYHCLVSKLIAWCSENKYLQKPNLYRNVSQFAIGCSFEYELLLICRKPFIKVVLRSLQSERSSEFQPAFSVRTCLENCLAVLKKECHGYRSIGYQISVLCPPCSLLDGKCRKHKQGKCRDDECLHLLPVNKDRVLFCETIFKTISAPRLEEWYTDNLKSTELPRTEMGIDGSEQSAIAICPEYLACIEHDILTISADMAAEKIAELLQLNKTSLKDPPPETVRKVRCFCVYLKQKGRLDILNKLRTTIPSGMTGPSCVDEKVLYESLNFGKRKKLTEALYGNELWKCLADEFGISNSRFPIFDKKDNPVEEILEEVCKARRLTVGDLYDIIVKCGAAALADEFL